jgi:hypothetical protein
VTFGIVNNIWTGAPVNLDQGFDKAIRLPVERAEETFKYVEKWLDTNTEEDVFIFMHFMDPHVPYNPPKPYNTQFDPDYSGKYSLEFKEIDDVRSGKIKLTPDELEHIKALYDGEIAYFDSQFQAFTKYLGEKSLLDDTLIVICADHGEEFAEHGGYEHGGTLYDEVIHVPLIMRGPDIPTGKVDDRVASNIDIFPTILGYFNIQPPDDIQGSSLLKPLPEEERNLISEQILYGDELKGITTNEYRYIFNTVNGNEELYDLKDDKAMLHSVAEDRKATMRPFRGYIISYIQNTSSPWHVIFSRQGEVRGAYTYSGTITIAGGFANVKGSNFTSMDAFQIDRDNLTFRLTSKPGSDKQLDFVPKDASAEVKFMINRDGRPLTDEGIFVGPGLDPVAGPEFTLSINDPRFNLGQPNLQREINDGVFIWANPMHPEQGKLELTPEMQEELKSIGYLN